MVDVVDLGCLREPYSGAHPDLGEAVAKRGRQLFLSEIASRVVGAQ